jgi:hypothetical protein
MALKMRIDSLDDVHEDIRSAYVKARDGNGFELDFAAIKEHPGVAKVRQTANEVDKKRTDAEKALAALQDKYGDLDPDEAKAAMAAAEELKDKKMIDAGKIDELVANKVEQMKKNFDTQMAAKAKALEDLTGGNTSLTAELADIKIFDAIKDAALGRGARKEALVDIKGRAMGVWSLKDGKPVAMNGEDAIFGKSSEPLTIAEWVDTLASESPHLFESNKGGGAPGSNSSSFIGAKSVSPDHAGDNIAAIASGEMTIDH